MSPEDCSSVSCSHLLDYAGAQLFRKAHIQLKFCFGPDSIDNQVGIRQIGLKLALEEMVARNRVRDALLTLLLLPVFRACKYVEAVGVVVVDGTSLRERRNRNCAELGLRWALHSGKGRES